MMIIKKRGELNNFEIILKKILIVFLYINLHKHIKKNSFVCTKTGYSFFSFKTSKLFLWCFFPKLCVSKKGGKLLADRS